MLASLMAPRDLFKLNTLGQCEARCPAYNRLTAIFGERDGGVPALRQDSLHDNNVAHQDYPLPPRIPIPTRSPTPSDDAQDTDAPLLPTPSSMARRSRSPTRSNRTASISDRSHGRASRADQLLMDNTDRWMRLEEEREAAKIEEKRQQRLKEEAHNDEMRKVARENLENSRRGTRAATTTGWARGYMDYPVEGEVRLTWEAALSKAERRFDRQTEDLTDAL